MDLGLILLELVTARVPAGAYQSKFKSRTKFSHSNANLVGYTEVNTSQPSVYAVITLLSEYINLELSKPVDISSFSLE